MNEVDTKLALGCYALTIGAMIGTVPAVVNRNMKAV
jgi:hypothetical protein